MCKIRRIQYSIRQTHVTSGLVIDKPFFIYLQPTGGKERSMHEAKLLYVVQRCWHSGPKQYQPLDYLRLFHTQREAEEAAYHSAHAWMKAQNHGRDGDGGAIKTLLLPSYPSHNPQGSSYGFIAKGTLFWVRACVATIVVGSGGGGVSGGAICHTQAYAILTEGVIGGTGNRNSRRGTEISEGRVFGGDASAHQLASLEATRIQNDLMRGQSPGSVPISVTIATLIVGKPPEYSSQQFLADWPQEVLQAPVLMDDADFNHRQAGEKRAILLDSSLPPSSSTGPWIELNNQQIDQYTMLEDGIVVDCPFEMPESKRRRTSS